MVCGIFSVYSWDILKPQLKWVLIQVAESRITYSTTIELSTTNELHRNRLSLMFQISEFDNAKRQDKNDIAVTQTHTEFEKDKRQDENEIAVGIEFSKSITPVWACIICIDEIFLDSLRWGYALRWSGFHVFDVIDRRTERSRTLKNHALYLSVTCQKKIWT